MAFLRFFLLLMVVLTIVFVALSMYSRAKRQETLERNWLEGAMDTDLDSYIEPRLEDFRRSMRWKLILGVYVLPLSVITILIYVTNTG